MNLKNPLKGKSTAVKVLVVLGIALLLIAAVYAATQLTIHSSGTIKTSASLSADVTEINWGLLNPTDSVDHYVTLTNNGDNPTLPLTVSTTPSPPTVGTLAHNATGKVIQPHDSIIVDFRLIISASPPTGAFSFDITISG